MALFQFIAQISKMHEELWGHGKEAFLLIGCTTSHSAKHFFFCVLVASKSSDFGFNRITKELLEAVPRQLRSSIEWDQNGTF